jgi:hypothetical protein
VVHATAPDRGHPWLKSGAAKSRKSPRAKPVWRALPRLRVGTVTYGEPKRGMEQEEAKRRRLALLPSPRGRSCEWQESTDKEHGRFVALTAVHAKPPDEDRGTLCELLETLCERLMTHRGCAQAPCARSMTRRGGAQAPCSRSVTRRGFAQAPCERLMTRRGRARTPCSRSVTRRGFAQAPCERSVTRRGRARTPCSRSVTHRGCARAPCERSMTHRGCARMPCSRSVSRRPFPRAPPRGGGAISWMSLPRTFSPGCHSV